MQISGYGAVSQATWPTEQKRRTVNNQEESGSRGDTVSFSDEAMALLAQMQQAKAEAAEKQTEADLTKNQDEKSDQDARDESKRSSAGGNTGTKIAMSDTAESQSGFGDTAGEHSEQKAEESSVAEQNKAGGGGGGGGSSDSVEAQIEQLKAKIKSLTANLQKVMSSPTQSKELNEAQARPLEEQISQLQSQVAELEAQLQEQA